MSSSAQLACIDCSGGEESSASSISRCPVDSGSRKAMRALACPIRGVSSISLTPLALSSASARQCRQLLSRCERGSRRVCRSTLRLRCRLCPIQESRGKSRLRGTLRCGCCIEASFLHIQVLIPVCFRGCRACWPSGFTATAMCSIRFIFIVFSRALALVGRSINRQPRVLLIQ